jgi:hypothetical protein
MMNIMKRVVPERMKGMVGTPTKKMMPKGRVDKGKKSVRRYT